MDMWIQNKFGKNNARKGEELVPEATTKGNERET